jgi:hypothetical protein
MFLANRYHKRKWLVTIFRPILIVFVIICLVTLLKTQKHKRYNVNVGIKLIENCDPHFPDEKDLFIDNFIWQILQSPSGHLRFLNAYLDTRPSKAVVRINSNGPKVYLEKIKVFCQFWYEKHNEKAELRVVQASEVQTLVPGLCSF